MSIVWLDGGSAPLREALTARFEARDVRVVTSIDEVESDLHGRVVALTYCRTDEDWQRFAAQSTMGLLAYVALIEQLDLEQYRRALRIRAGVVHVDTSTEIIAAVTLAAGEGEAVLPMEMAHRLAQGGEQRHDHNDDLDFIETEFLRSIAQGETIVSLAERHHYSERTIRRRLQSAFVKLGVENRAEAIRAIERMGLLGSN